MASCGFPTKQIIFQGLGSANCYTEYKLLTSQNQCGHQDIYLLNLHFGSSSELLGTAWLAIWFLTQHPSWSLKEHKIKIQLHALYNAQLETTNKTIYNVFISSFQISLLKSLCHTSTPLDKKKHQHFAEFFCFNHADLGHLRCTKSIYVRVPRPGRPRA